MKKKILKMLMFAVVFFISTQIVSAETYNGKLDGAEYIPGVYVKKVRSELSKYNHARIIRRSTDNKHVYCLEAFVDINNDNKYEVYSDNQANILNISEEDWERVNLLAYYGYLYGNHTDLKWFSITQVLIWRTVDKTSDFYWTDVANGNRINVFESEIRELEDLVTNHNKKPSFNGNSISINFLDKLEIEDTNKILDYYEISDNLDNISINDNKLIVENNTLNDYQIELTRKDNRFTEGPLLYFNSTSQNIMFVGKYNNINASISIKTKVKIKINKINSNTKEKINVSNIEFKIFDINNDEYITIDNSDIFTTDHNGEIIINSLEKGEYKIEELDQDFEGYLWNQEGITFTIDENSNVTDEGILVIDFPNTPKELPPTGVNEISLRLLASILIVPSITILISKRKRSCDS